MMREVLFRGKTVFDNTWIVGSLVINKVDTPKEFREVYRICDNTYGFADEDGFEPDFMVGYDEEVDPSTVGQYTGLTANGKRIFEGDIFEWGYAGVKEFRYVVAYDADVASFVGNRHSGFVSLNGIEIEIIGNIHDNPELLEVDHD